MFKKFYIYIGFLSLITSFIFSFSSNNNNLYFYPIKNNSLISSFYGARILFNKYNFHSGIDIPAHVSSPVFSINSGVVKYIGFDNNGYGNYIIILHNNAYKSLYAHLSEETLVNIGQSISRGELISYVGPKTLSNGKQNGNTTGPHLHLTIYSNTGKTIDPLTLDYEKK